MYALNLRSLGATVLGTLLASSAVAVPATTQVLTPKGLRPAAGLIQVPAGGRIEHVGDELHLIAADGAVLHVASKGTSPSPNTAPPTPEETGWITYANWLNTVLIGEGAHIGSFNTTWSVPPVPAAWHNQTVFLFNALEPDSFDEIVQPVLQVLAFIAFVIDLLINMLRSTAYLPQVEGNSGQLHRGISIEAPPSSLHLSP